MSIANLLMIAVISISGDINTDIFFHRNGFNSYNLNFKCKNPGPNDYLKIKINTSKIYKHHRYINPAKNIKMFSLFNDNIGDSIVRTLDSTVIYISKKPDILSFTLSFNTYNNAIFDKDSAIIFPFSFHVYPELNSKIEIYMPDSLFFNIKKIDNLSVTNQLIEYKGKQLNNLSNVYIAVNRSDIKEKNYSLFSFYFSLMWSYIIPILLIILIFLYVNMGKYRKITYIPNVVVYSPPRDLSPGEINFLLNDTLNLNGMVSIAFDIARKGFITITREVKASPFSKPDFKIERIKKQGYDNLTPYELKVLKAFFPFPRDRITYLSDKSNVLKRKYTEIIGDLSAQMAQSGYYNKDPLTRRVSIIIFGIVVTIIGTIMLFFGYSHKQALPAYQHHIEFSVIISGVIIALSNKFFKFKTPMGDYTLAEIKGFGEYFFRVEKDKIKYSTENLLTDFYTTYATAMNYNSQFLSEFKYYLSDLYKEKDGTDISNDILSQETKIII